MRLLASAASYRSPPYRVGRCRPQDATGMVSGIGK